MFDIGWTELLVVAVVMVLVVGPKDLPRMLRTFGQTLGKVRRMANEFQSTFNDALREAEQQADIADMKAEVEKVGNLDPLGDLKRTIEEDTKRKAARKAKAEAAASASASAAEVPPAPVAPGDKAAVQSEPAGEQPKAAGDSKA
ncbi:Sec-independent protein translocase protein TatB [Stappia indica]|uniref:Sec-independent protein translocase protein TatB n=1 Tax=Stappia indica TaxID=538381 RepID=UPI001CD52808|nr:Sec-independent protein translocase protein TatB [Stappia indica]MCA1296914.1 Sec-independent protein translocase protein TatB [Stappia indica]